MSEFAVRLWLGSTFSIIAMLVLALATDLSTVLVIVLGLLIGFILSIIDVVMIFLVEGVAELLSSF